MVMRYEYLEALSKMLKDELVVTNTASKLGQEWETMRPSDLNLYSVGMGLVSSVALGLAMALPDRKVISLDGDGSLLLDLSILSTIAKRKQPNLSVVALDNKCYGNGGLPTNTADVADLASIARASGIESVFRIADTQQFITAAKASLTTDGPHFIHAETDPGSRKYEARVTYGRFNKFRFVVKIEEDYGLKILKPFVYTRPTEGSA